MRRYICFSIGILLGILIASTSVVAEVSEREVDMVVIHHSATEQGSVEAFRRYHVEERGWKDVGYHFVIGNGNGADDGKIQRGRPLNKQGAHARGRNARSVGVCLVGNGEFTDNQLRSLVRLVASLALHCDLELSEETLQGHHEECPGGIDLEALAEEANALRRHWEQQ